MKFKYRGSLLPEIGRNPAGAIRTAGGHRWSTQKQIVSLCFPFFHSRSFVSCLCWIPVVGLLLLPLTAMNQSNIEDAKALLRIKRLLDAKNGGMVDFATTEANLITDADLTRLAELVLTAEQRRQPATGTRPSAMPAPANPNAAVPPPGASNAPVGNFPNAPVGSPPNAGASGSSTAFFHADFDKALLTETKNEIKWIVSFLNRKCELFDVKGELAIDMAAYQNGFEHLHSILAVLQKQRPGSPTSTGFFDNIIGVSEADILKGIADWSLSRAQEELMQSFLRQWLDEIQSDSILAAAFPNTLNMLAHSELTTIYTNSETWKETFRQDLDNIPANLPEIVDLSLAKAGDPLDPKAKRELLAGLRNTIRLFDEVGNGKSPDEVLISMGEAAYLQYAQRVDADVAIIDRSMVATNALLSSLRTVNHLGIADGYVKPSAVYNLSDEEVSLFWCLTYLRQRGKFKLAFDLDDATEAAFYRHVANKSVELRLVASNLTKDIQNLIDVVKTAKTTEEGELNFEHFHTYLTLVINLSESGLDMVETFSPRPEIRNKFAHFKSTYFKLYNHVALIHEGIKTKRYGKVVLNLLNSILCIEEIARKNGVDTIAVQHLQRDLNSLVDHLEANDNIQVGTTWPHAQRYPESSKILSEAAGAVNRTIEDATRKDPPITVAGSFAANINPRDKKLINDEISSGFMTAINRLHGSISAAQPDATRIRKDSAALEQQLAELQQVDGAFHKLFHAKYTAIKSDLFAGRLDADAVSVAFYVSSDATDQLISNLIGQYIDKSALKAKMIKHVRKAIEAAITGYIHSPAAHNLLKNRYERFKNDLKGVEQLEVGQLKEKLNAALSFSPDEQRTLAVALAENIQRTSRPMNKYAKLMASIVLAEESDDIKDALEVAAMKTGGYLIKQKSAFSASVTFYPGAEYGWENLRTTLGSTASDTSNSTGTNGSYFGVTLPIGVEASFGLNWRPIGAVGIYLQALDLGGVLNYSLSNAEEDVETAPEFGFKQVLSPGAYVTVHLSNNPITLGYGISFSPQLRNIRDGDVVTGSNVLQHGFLLTVDLNVFPIYSSQKKYALTTGK